MRKINQNRLTEQLLSFVTKVNSRFVLQGQTDAKATQVSTIALFCMMHWNDDNHIVNQSYLTSIIFFSFCKSTSEYQLVN